MPDPVLVVTAALVSLTLIVALLYYRRIKRVSTAYDEAKSVVGDIVISFDKQLQRHEEQVAVVIGKVETQAAKNEKLSQRLDEQEKTFTTRLADASSKVVGPSDLKTVKSDLEDLKNQVADLVRVQEEFKEHTLAMSESQIETAIPIKRERALASLTETELRVLEFIASADEKTAPEVRDMIKLTREHTARLMKKLYHEGYLERRSEKTPYAYRLKEEMLKILKKSEAKA